MKLSLLSIISLIGATSVYADNYNQEILKIKIVDDATRNYKVNGSTVNIEMQYFNGTASGDYFNGTTIRNSSVVLKKFKNVQTKSTSRYILSGKDAKNNECNIFIEDNSVAKKGTSVISKPSIITDCPDLGWLQTADLQTRLKDKGKKGKTLQLMWNKHNKSEMPYPPVKIPDSSKTYDKKLFVFDIEVATYDIVNGANNALAVMIGFTCSANFDTFKGVGLDNFVDTRMQFPGQIQSLSARYILKGKDDEGHDTMIYVENDGTDVSEDHTYFETEPLIVTDNPKWTWIETAPLHGIPTSDPFQIHLYTVNDPSLWNKPASESESESESE